MSVIKTRSKRKFRRVNVLIAVTCLILALVIFAAIVPVRSTEIHVEGVATDLTFRISEKWNPGRFNAHMVSISGLCPDSVGNKYMSAFAVEKSEKVSLEMTKFFDPETIFRISSTKNKILFSAETNSNVEGLCSKMNSAISASAKLVPPKNGMQVQNEGLGEEVYLGSIKRLNFDRHRTILFSDNKKHTLKLNPIRIDGLSFGKEQGTSSDILSRLSSIKTAHIEFAAFADKTLNISGGSPLQMKVRNAVMHNLEVEAGEIRFSVIAKVDEMEQGLTVSGEAVDFKNIMPTYFDVVAESRLFKALAAMFLTLISVFSIIDVKQIFTGKTE